MEILKDDDPRLLSPDEHILTGIFPEWKRTGITTEILSNSFDTCTFRATFPDGTKPTPSLAGYTNLLVRLETAGGNLKAVAALQRIAHHQIPDLVLPTLALGNCSNNEGKQLEYSIVPFLSEATPLEDVWQSLDGAEQAQIMDSIVEAMCKLQAVDLHGPKVWGFLEQHTDGVQELLAGRTKKSIGNLQLGFHRDIKSLLKAIRADVPETIKAELEAGCQIIQTADGIELWFTIAGQQGLIEFSHAALDDLAKASVFCHNDLEPRNILIKQDPGGPFRIAAIIDWEMAGFFPFSYEFGAKATQLGTNNLYYSWYNLFKRSTRPLLSQGGCHDKLLRALWLLGRCKESLMTGNVSVAFKKKWMAREHLMMSYDIREGWVREDGAGPIQAFTKENNEVLEEEVLKELGIL